MGSYIEINDTLRITTDQGFPAELDVQKHLTNPYTLADVQDKVFSFKAKPNIRVYHRPPVRNFLVQDIGGKWLYWGLCHILSVTHDYITQETSGTFKIIHINTPQEMEQAFHLVDQNPETNYFTQSQEKQA